MHKGTWSDSGTLPIDRSGEFLVHFRAMEDVVINAMAAEHFHQARSRANRQQWLARFTGRKSDLLPFEDIRALLRQQNPIYQGLQVIDLDQITGSVGRYQDFNRQFLPLTDSLQFRWVQVEALAVTSGWPPIEVYRVGGIYFVRDGNHRVAVARQMEQPTIEAHVWEFPAEIQIGPENSLDEVLNRFEEQRFMADTGLDKFRPDHGISFTSPGRYPELQAQIAEMGNKLAIIDGRVPTDEEVVTAWYDLVYLPTVQIIREANLLAAFPGRTVADLFVWLSVHRQELNRRFGTHDHLSDLTSSLVEQYSEHGMKLLWRKLGQRLGYRTLPDLHFPEAEKPT